MTSTTFPPDVFMHDGLGKLYPDHELEVYMNGGEHTRRLDDEITDILAHTPRNKDIQRLVKPPILGETSNTCLVTVSPASPWASDGATTPLGALPVARDTRERAPKRNHRPRQPTGRKLFRPIPLKGTNGGTLSVTVYNRKGDILPQSFERMGLDDKLLLNYTFGGTLHRGLEKAQKKLQMTSRGRGRGSKKV